MAESKIEWTHRPGTVGRTWNPVVGCTKVSPGCDHCYALRQSNRFQHSPSYQGLTKMMVGPQWTGEIRWLPERLSEPLTWKKPSTVFVCSMSDLCHDRLPWQYRLSVFRMMAQTPLHLYLVLTKRPEVLAEFAEMVWATTPDLLGLDALPRPWPSNVWVGTSVESQKYARRLDVLARVPAKVRFVSVEPMLGPVDLTRWLEMCECGDSKTNHIDGGQCCLLIPGLCPCTQFKPVLSWTITGGESGPGARPMHPDWVRNLRDQCQSAGVPFFFKQWGEWAPENAGNLDAKWAVTHLHPRSQWDRLEQANMYRVGKTAAGALLDGREWREWPT